MTFSLESQLVETFIELSNNSEDEIALSKDSIANEYDYRNGRVDIISRNQNEELIAVEAKLNKWRKALNQAYKNTSFAHYSFVLLPPDVANNAFKRRVEFENRGVGIITIFEGRIKQILNPSKKQPIQPWLTEKAFEYLNKTKDEYSRTCKCS